MARHEVYRAPHTEASGQMRSTQGQVCQHSYQDLTTLTTRSSPFTGNLVRSHIKSPTNARGYKRWPIRNCGTLWIGCSPMQINNGVARSTLPLMLGIQRALVFSQQHLTSTHVLSIFPPGAHISSRSYGQVKFPWLLPPSLPIKRARANSSSRGRPHALHIEVSVCHKVTLCLELKSDWNYHSNEKRAGRVSTSH